MLEFRDVSVSVGRKRILDSVSFALRPGTVTALVGRNGSGKSTLLACVNQQMSYRGQIFMGQQELSGLSPRERARQVAILPQNIPAPHIPARDMVAFGRNPYLDLTGRLREADLAAVEQAMEDTDVLPVAEQFADTLSGGERQRAALAMILAQNTPIMLLDEPTAHMDKSYEENFLRLLCCLKQTRGKTVLVVLHDLTAAVAYADDIAVLDGGKLLFSGTKEKCLDREILEKTFDLKRYTAEDGKIFFSAK